MVTLSEAQSFYARHLRQGGLWEERVLRSAAGSDGDFTAGPHEELSIPASEKGVLAEIEIGSDAPIQDVAALMVGHRIVEGGDAQIAAQTVRARPDIDLETAADGEATGGARVGIGIVTDRSNPVANAMDFRDEALIDDAVTSRENIDPITPSRTGHRTGLEGDHLVVVTQSPPSAAESYGLDHSSIELPVIVLPRSKVGGR